MFRSDTNVPDKKKMKNLNLRERKHLSMTSEIDAESNLSEDYSDSDWTPSMWGNKFSRWQRRISFYFFFLIIMDLR